MKYLKNVCRKIPIVYPIWHFLRIKMNIYKEKRKRKAYQRYGMDILRDIYRVVNTHNYKLICIWGTLLGIIRDNRLLPWDDDLDFVMLDEGRFSWIKFDSLMRQAGFSVYRVIEENNAVVEKSYIKKHVVCDVRLWKDYNVGRTIHGDYFEIDKIEYINGQYCEYEVADMYMIPINSVSFLDFKGIQVQIPENSEELLASVYGEGWKNPDPNYKTQRIRKRMLRKVTYYK